MILLASRLLTDPERFYDGGGVLVRAGRIVEVFRSPAAVRRARTRTGERLVDLGEGVLAPGLVNAHAHLELSGLAGELPRDAGFAAWVAAVLAARERLGPDDYVRAVAEGARRALETGTTTVGDVVAVDPAIGAPRLGLRTVLFREVLDAWDPLRTADALARVGRGLPVRRTRIEGISPHAPFTTSRELLAGVAEIARRRALPVTVHWAETEAEGEWLEEGGGPLARFLPRSPRARGLELLARAGLLGHRTSLVHGNHPRRGEPALLARRGVALVHCPGSHAFFARAPFPWARYRRAGVRLALGSDSLASNQDLDLRREMALARAALPGLSPERAFGMATLGGAYALGLARRLGHIRAGLAADLVLHRIEEDGRRNVLEALSGGGGEVAGVWVAGRRVVPVVGSTGRGAPSLPPLSRPSVN